MRAPAASFCLTLLVATAFGVPRPQDPVSADDILGNSARLLALKSKPDFILQILGLIKSMAQSNKEFFVYILGFTIFKYSDWLKNLSSQSECLKICIK